MLKRVLSFAFFWCALLGWSLVALALARSGPLFGIALLGFAAAFLQKRIYVLTLVAEVFLFGIAGSLIGPEGFWLLWTGGVFLAFGRALSLFVRQREGKLFMRQDA